MMQIKNLNNTDLEDIVFAILISFEGYFLTMPTETAYWAQRFKIARVDFNFSFGMFKNDVLIGFIILGIDERGGDLIAFNTGTGVVPQHRNKGIVDQLYAHAIPLLKQQGISLYSLEVIQENSRAIRVYERIGFSKTKAYLCFKGKLPASAKLVTIQTIDHSTLHNPFEHFYAWDNCDAAIKMAPLGCYKTYKVQNNRQEAIGFFVINPQTGHLPQFEIFAPTNTEHWELLFDGIAQVSRSIKIVNVDAKRKDLIAALNRLNLENNINQYEMEFKH